MIHIFYFYLTSANCYTKMKKIERKKVWFLDDLPRSCCEGNAKSDSDDYTLVDNVLIRNWLQYSFSCDVHCSTPSKTWAYRRDVKLCMHMVCSRFKCPYGDRVGYCCTWRYVKYVSGWVPRQEFPSVACICRLAE